MLNYIDIDYFTAILQDDESLESALELLVDDLQSDREATVFRLICLKNSSDILWKIFRLFSSSPNVAGSSAYIIGTVAETPIGQIHICNIIRSGRTELRSILESLINMLTFKATECVLNAAGTLATLADVSEGREWILSDASIVMKAIINLSNLLSNECKWISSNAALVFARLTISDDGCEVILNHRFCETLINRLIDCLVDDDTGQGMNAAFALGRIANTPAGRSRLMESPNIQNMLTSLIRLLSSKNPSCCKNSCCALSCFMSGNDSHAMLMRNALHQEMLSALHQLLKSSDEETQWFAAMTVKTLAQKVECNIIIRSQLKLMKTLMHLEKNPATSKELLAEVLETLKSCQPLCTPGPPSIGYLGSQEVQASWRPVEDYFKLPVNYKLYQDNQCIYHGSDTKFIVRDLTPNTEYSLQVRAVTDYDESGLSEPVVVCTTEDKEEEGDIGSPTDLVILAQKPTQLKIAWHPPESNRHDIKSYSVFLDGELYDSTTETVSIFSGLSPSTSYNLAVSCNTDKGQSELSSISCHTADCGHHAPSKPDVTIRGRFELFASWKPPVVPLGRITRYELCVDGNAVYSGTDLHHTINRLKPDTEYMITVAVITSEGKFESKATRKKTAKDEFEKRKLESLESVASERKHKRSLTNDASSGHILSYTSLRHNLSPIESRYSAAVPRRNTDPVISGGLHSSHPSPIRSVSKASPREIRRRNTADNVLRTVHVKPQQPVRTTLNMSQQRIVLPCQNEARISQSLTKLGAVTTSAEPERSLHKYSASQSSNMANANHPGKITADGKRVSVTSLSLRHRRSSVYGNSLDDLIKSYRKKCKVKSKSEPREPKRMSASYSLNSENSYTTDYAKESHNFAPERYFDEFRGLRAENNAYVSKKQRNVVMEDEPLRPSIDLPQIVNRGRKLSPTRISRKQPLTKDSDSASLIWKPFLPVIK